ncbi:hypothetical protein [Chromobacterium violaceum]|uniref:hypothetical protein n=1 Tax=Chromobacterium violaceum TaxID=536 RepID=UPI000A60258A|nr:hypothetical protein [Chromobacterium violaceum]
MGKFEQKLLSSTIKLPTQKGFSLTAWDKAWKKYGEDDNRDEQLYLAGKFIFSQLDAVRNSISNIYTKHAPKITYKKLLRLYCAMSNRDASILLKGLKEKGEELGNLFSHTTKNNKLNNEISAEEVAIGSVDGLEGAIFNSIKGIFDKKEIANSNNPLDLIGFIEAESILSQIYSMYEDYWHSILYRKFEIDGLAPKNKKITISQPITKQEIAYLVSHTRRIRLKATSTISKINKHINDFDDKKIILITGGGKAKKFKVDVIGKQDIITKHKNISYLLEMEDIRNTFSASLIEVDHENSGFTVYECMEVFRLLMFLADSYFKRFPQDDGFFSANKLIEFCPTIKKPDLIMAISQATEFNFQKINSIVDFLTFTPAKNSDLWAQPILPAGGNDLYFLVSAAAQPMLERVVERWLVKLGVDLTYKGDPYELKVIETISNGMKKCTFSEGTCAPSSISISIGGVKEQIDVIFRIGNKVVVGEAKSIIATDSSISFYRAVNILEGAADQILRKAKHIANDLEACFSRLGWHYKENENYDVIPIIFNSNRILAGFQVSTVPVLDEKIVYAYFASNEFPLFSVPNGNGVNHIAKFMLYNDERGFIENFEKYINNPPQTLGDSSSYEQKETVVPYLGSDEIEVAFRRLIPVNFSAKEMLRRKYPFPVEMVPDIESYLEELSLII